MPTTTTSPPLTINTLPAASVTSNIDKMLSERLSMQNCSNSLGQNNKFTLNGSNFLYDKIKTEKNYETSSSEMSPKPENGDGPTSVHSNNNNLANNNNTIKSERLSPSNSNNSSNSNTTNSVGATNNNNNHSNHNSSGNGNINSLNNQMDNQSITSR